MLSNSPKPGVKPSRWEGLSVSNHIKENVDVTYQRRKSRTQESEPQREVRIESTHCFSALLTVASLFFTNLAEVQVGVKAILKLNPRDRKKHCPLEEGTICLLPYE